MEDLKHCTERLADYTERVFTLCTKCEAVVRIPNLDTRP